MSEREEHMSGPTRHELAGSSQRFAGGLDEMAVVDTAWARWFAASALHTCGERSDDFIGDGGVVLVDFPHQPDSAAGRQCLIAGHTKRWTMWQAEAALNAGVEFIGIESEVHQVWGLRPGFRRPLGSKSIFIRSATTAMPGSSSRLGGAVSA